MGVLGDFSVSGLGIGLEACPGTLSFHENPRVEAVGLKTPGLDSINGVILGDFSLQRNHFGVGCPARP